MWTRLDELEFLDDQALLFSQPAADSKRTTVIRATSTNIGFKILKEKSKILKINSSIPEPITLDGNHSRRCKILSI